MNIRHNEVLREKLAAEYVLGTLRGGARRRLESWLLEDAALRRAVAEWQDRLLPLSEMAARVLPSPQVWQGIDRQITAEIAGKAGKPAHWLDSLRFWRALSMASFALSLVLAAFIVLHSQQRSPLDDSSTMQASLDQQHAATAGVSYVAVLTGKDAQAAMVVTADQTRHQLQVRVVMPQPVTSNEDLELWALPEQGPPRSLGLLVNQGEAIVTLPDSLMLAQVPALAVSLEHKGGSGNPNAPGGPVLLKGELIKI
ncbi:anti-sigma-K factor RskA [Herbaspirillum sp. Sphag1AN]|uniref:anti-sigma factor n=1 Tax=unclassified Herbaspirillum TaxID=2624150 RepID=UPI001619C6F2|nr:MULTISPECIES: anti-sigma factor [unclassified Herbaspirillum]MBB3212485.1 anti-sigma-K factor RskA [Herbaspirillum sp. Sphag1AN]MBB3245416.1 anti-sigma-K factor RskA [Herbaspirillum sp. Sphag64]